MTCLTHATCGENGSKTVGQGLRSGKKVTTQPEGVVTATSENQEASGFEVGQLSEWRGLKKESCPAHMCLDTAWVLLCGASSESNLQPTTLHHAHASVCPPHGWLGHRPAALQTGSQL